MSIVTRSSRLIDPATGVYPLYLSDLPRYAPNTVFGLTVDSSLLSAFGLKVVHPVGRPIADNVVEGVPTLVSGEWYQTWITRDFTEGEVAGQLTMRKVELQAEAEVLRISQFERGFAYEFNEGIYHVQIRNDDRSNLTSLRIIAKEVVAASASMNFQFRVYENIGVNLTAPELIAMTDAAFAAVQIGYQKIWAFKDAITAANTVAELPTAPDAATLFTLPA